MTNFEKYKYKWFENADTLTNLVYGRPLDAEWCDGRNCNGNTCDKCFREWLDEEAKENTEKTYIKLDAVLKLLKHHSNCCGNLDCCADDIRTEILKLETKEIDE